MIKNLKILLLVTFFIIHNSYSFAENKISFIDVNFIFMNSNAGKKVNDQIKNKREKINKEFLIYKKNIDDKQKKLFNK